MWLFGSKGGGIEFVRQISNPGKLWIVYVFHSRPCWVI